MEAIDEAQFRILIQILNTILLYLTIRTAKYPTNVRPKRVFHYWRMDIFFFIRVLVMVAMIRRPPHRAQLCR